MHDHINENWILDTYKFCLFTFRLNENEFPLSKKFADNSKINIEDHLDGVGDYLNYLKRKIVRALAYPLTGQ